MFWISEFKMADADRMAAVLEASKKWQNEKKTIFYVLVTRVVCMHLLTTFYDCQFSHRNHGEVIEWYYYPLK